MTDRKSDQTETDSTTKQRVSLRKRSVVQRIYDWLFGYDFFICYRWSDGSNYARILAAELRKRGYECFLDADDFEPGGNWQWMDYQALRRTSRLVLVATHDAISDPEGRVGREDPIVDELSAFANKKGHKVRILFPDHDPETWRDSQLSRFFEEKELYLEEAETHRTTPSSDNLLELTKLIGLQTQARRRNTVLWSVLFVLVVLLTAAVLFGREANIQRNLALEKTEETQRTLKLERASRANLLLSVARRDWASGRRDMAAARFARALAINPLNSDLRKEVVDKFSKKTWYPSAKAQDSPIWAGQDAALGTVVAFKDGSILIQKSLKNSDSNSIWSAAAFDENDEHIYVGTVNGELLRVSVEEFKANHFSSEIVLEGGSWINAVTPVSDGITVGTESSESGEGENRRSYRREIQTFITLETRGPRCRINL